MGALGSQWCFGNGTLIVVHRLDLRGRDQIRQTSGTSDNIGMKCDMRTPRLSERLYVLRKKSKGGGSSFDLE